MICPVMCVVLWVMGMIVEMTRYPAATSQRSSLVALCAAYHALLVLSLACLPWLLGSTRSSGRRRRHRRSRRRRRRHRPVLRRRRGGKRPLWATPRRFRRWERQASLVRPLPRCLSRLPVAGLLPRLAGLRRLALAGILPRYPCLPPPSFPSTLARLRHLAGILPRVV